MNPMGQTYPQNARPMKRGLRRTGTASKNSQRKTPLATEFMARSGSASRKPLIKRVPRGQNVRVRRTKKSRRKITWKRRL
jgi:hypothetical protein